jgi:hypothetical protein
MTRNVKEMKSKGKNLNNNNTMGVKKVNVEINAKDNASAKFRKVGAAFTAMGAGLGVLTKGFVKAAADQEKSEIILANSLKNIAGASDEQVEALKKQAVALQKVGVIGDEVTMMGQAQFATFQASTDAIMALTPAMQDYAVATFGAKVSSEQMNQAANVFGKLLQGIDIGRLKNQGIIVSDAQRAVLEYGDEAERVAIIQEVMAANLKVTNEIMRSTTEGALQGMRNDFGDLAEIMGSALLPVISKFSGAMSSIISKLNETNPRLLKVIGLVTAIGAAFGLIVGPTLLFIGIAAPAFGMVAAAATAMWIAITGPIGIVIAALAAVGVALYATRDVWVPVIMEMWTSFLQFTEGVRMDVAELVTAMKTTVTEYLDGWRWFVEAYGAELSAWVAAIKSVFTVFMGTIAIIFRTGWEVLQVIFGTVWDLLLGAIKTAMAIFRGDWKDAWEAIVETFESIFGRFGESAEQILGTVLKWINNTIGGISKAIEKFQQLKNLTLSNKGMEAQITTIEERRAADLAAVRSGEMTSIPARANGGPVSAGKTYLVGERGPERFVPSSGGTIIPNGGGGGINLFFEGIFGQDAAEEIGDMVVSKLNLHTAY